MDHSMLCFEEKLLNDLNYKKKGFIEGLWNNFMCFNDLFYFIFSLQKGFENLKHKNNWKLK